MENRQPLATSGHFTTRNYIFRFVCYITETLKQVVVIEMVLQGPLSNVCDEFCVFFGYFLCRGWRLADILKYFNDDLSFSKKAVYLQVQKLFPDHCRTF